MQYINEQNFWYLCEGLTYTASDLKVLDGLLEAYNQKTGHIDQIIKGSGIHGFQQQVKIPGPQILFTLDKLWSREKGNLAIANAGLLKNVLDQAPALHLTLHSPLFQVPQRIELPLKYILNGLPPLTGTHMVYLHAIEINDSKTYSYYGKTKRGWMKRFIEHVKLANKGSKRKFPELYGRAMENRIKQL